MDGVHRWSGYFPKRRRVTFGADATIFLTVPKRENGDKIGAHAKGGNGRYRYLGPHTGLGTSSKGDLIFDLVEKLYY